MTTAAELLPRVARPPHDPLTLLLDGRVGWQLAPGGQQLAVSPVDGALELAPTPGGPQALGSGDGSFGGLVPPDNVAIGPDGIVLLLDRAHALLKRFDSCLCAFVSLPCIAGEGAGPRKLHDAAGVAACGDLYVCDAGNRRVQVFAPRGLVLRAIWTQPAAANLATPWRPVAVATSPRARFVYVGDPDNGCVHLFASTGRWLRAFSGLGAVAHLAVDCAGRLYVATQGSDQVAVLDPDTGALLQTPARADEVRERFAPLPFTVTASGGLRFGCGAFDATGAPVDAQDDPLPVVATTGWAITTALDSARHRCVWDRIALEGAFPAGSSVRLFVYTAEIALPDAVVAALPDGAWNACPALDGADHLGTRWDAMLRAGPGRYLWLKLVLGGDGHVTPRLDGVRLKFPRIGLRRFLPGTFGSDPLAAEFTDRFLAIFDRELRGIEHTIDDQARFFDPLSAPANDQDRSRDFLSWIAGWIGVSLDRSWSIERRRRFLKGVGRTMQRRGTPAALEDLLRLYLGLPAENDCPPPPPCRRCGPCRQSTPPRWRPPRLLLEHFRLRRWLFVGRGRLGEQARVWGESIVNRSRVGGAQNGQGTARVAVSQLNTRQDPLRDPFHVYAHKFSVFAPAAALRTPAARRGFERLLATERLAHAAYQVIYVEPRFRIGIQSMIGFDAAIASAPAGGITLDAEQLGKATVLGGDGPPDLTVGQQARIGTTTRLT